MRTASRKHQTGVILYKKIQFLKAEPGRERGGSTYIFMNILHNSFFTHPIHGPPTVENPYLFRIFLFIFYLFRLNIPEGEERSRRVS